MRETHQVYNHNLNIVTFRGTKKECEEIVRANRGDHYLSVQKIEGK